MKKSEIKVGGLYRAKVSGKETTVRVDAIRPVYGSLTSTIMLGSRSADKTVYDVTNLATGRKTTFRSAAKFRSEARPDKPGTTLDQLRARQKAEKEEAKAEEVKVGNLEKPSYPEADPAPAAKVLTGLTARLQAATAHTDSAPHLIIIARAGTGKTTTLVEGLKKIKGLATSILPSSQQAAVWEQMGLSANARTICFVAFNKSIAEELKRRVPAGCDAMTMHSMGFKAVTKQFGRQEPNSFAVQDIIAELTGYDIRDLRQKKPVLLKATEELVSLCKMNLVDCDQGDERAPGSWDAALAQLASYYEVDLNGSRSEVFELVPRVLDRCKTPRGKITFDDMIWLPVVHKLPVFQYDLLLVDEAQDLNRCQQALAKMAGRRMVFCGDPKQAIYGFAGADAESMPRLEEELTATERGCVVLPLTVTRRCGKAIVEEAQRYVPDFEAHESNGEGVISTAVYADKEKLGAPDYTARVCDGDFVVCRVNAPLVSQCFRFLRMGRKANIQGRDVGQGLISTIKKVCGKTAVLSEVTVTEVIEKVSDWSSQEQAKEQAKRFPNEARLIAIQDRADCLYCFCEGVQTAQDVIYRIESIFTDNKNAPGIRLSSVHKAKGLEAKRVFVLRPEGAGMPHPMAKSAWQREQEMNLLYVAITRAIEELVWVS